MPRSIDRLSPDICAQTAQFAIQVLISSVNMIDIMNFRDTISDQSGTTSAAPQRRSVAVTSVPLSLLGPLTKQLGTITSMFAPILLSSAQCLNRSG